MTLDPVPREIVRDFDDELTVTQRQRAGVTEPSLERRLGERVPQSICNRLPENLGCWLGGVLHPSSRLHRVVGNGEHSSTHGPSQCHPSADLWMKNGLFSRDFLRSTPLSTGVEDENSVLGSHNTETHGAAA